jgi:hypothetical protein
MGTSFDPNFVARSALLAGWLATGCSSDHDLLAVKPDSGTGGTLTVTYGTSGTGVGSGGDNSGTGIEDAGDPEPLGPWSLTWLNGIVDQASTRVCLVPVKSGQEMATAAMPLPPGGALPFAGSFALGAVSGLDPRTDDLHPYLVPADGPGSCSDWLASEAGAGVVSLPVIPAGTLADGRSYLLVATGCVAPEAAGDGGPPSDKPVPSSDTVCGDDPSVAGASLALVRLSRIDTQGQLGFQVVHASAATPDALVVLSEPITGSTLFSISRLDFGQIAPAHEQQLVGRSKLDLNAGSASLRIAAGGTPSFPLVDATLASIFAASNLGDRALDMGDAFTFVLIGARPGAAVRSPWNAFQTVLLPNTPSGVSDAD